MLNLLPMRDWPSDAVMIVAAVPERANTALMESINPGNCRICETAIVYDGKTYRRAWSMPEREGRPIRFFCESCAALYKTSDCDVLESFAGGTHRILKSTAGNTPA